MDKHCYSKTMLVRMIIKTKWLQSNTLYSKSKRRSIKQPLISKKLIVPLTDHQFMSQSKHLFKIMTMILTLKEHIMKITIGQMTLDQTHI